MEFPHKLQLQPFSAGPAIQASRPDLGPRKEVISGICHGSAPVS
jgi:hypothetical protein